MTLIPNQPYPDKPGWQDISSQLINGWVTDIPGLFMRSHSDTNTVTIVGRVRIGEKRIMGITPLELLPNGYQGLSALIIAGPPCIVEIWNAGHIVMSNASLGLGEAGMIQTYQGRELYFTGSYPRKTA